MSRFSYDEDSRPMSMNQQRDLTLSINEFCFIQSRTNGVIRTYTGPITTPFSAQEAMVIFNPKTKQFEETSDFNRAKQLFVSAPEGWYIVLKNPESSNNHPDVGKASNSPDLVIGKKINIAGPCSFSLFQGQMAKDIQGHRLRSNQYLLARVYDADAANKNIEMATIVDTDGKEVKKKEKYFVGQLLVIKGTEVSFYIPPTGIEVIPISGSDNEYVRDAVTLERLEYAILKDEDGEKRYVHGPAVVFPKPTETFVTAPKGGTIFRALELSPISGIYVKVIADYVDEKGVKHPVGEELFITGNDQMIYYPRPEHAMIQYDGKYMHHAIAIPEGEGRYILNRLSGEITTIKGPQMYLPDPRTEVVVKRKLTEKECSLFYPGNTEVLEYNLGLTERAMEKLSRKGGTNAINDAINNAYNTANQESALAIFEATSNISRGVSYTKPRTITLDTKYDGVVSINVWTGYAVNVITKNGIRETIVGPAARMLNYDETLEAIELSTGTPKSKDKTIRTGYLRVENNKVSDRVIAQTKDFVDVAIEVSYCVNFLPEYKEKWFNVENYVQYLCERMRSLVKKEIKKHSIEDVYANVTDIVRNIVLNKGNEKKGTPNGRLFSENGMLIHDVEVLQLNVERKIAAILETHQEDMVRKCLELSDAEKTASVQAKLAEYERKEIELKHANALHKLDLEQKVRLEEMANKAKIEEQNRVQKEASTQAEANLQPILNAIQAEKLARNKKEDDARISTEKALIELEQVKQKAYANTVASIMASVSPELVAALTATANADMLETVTKSMAPYAIAKDESIADFTNKLLRGTTLENVMDSLADCKID